MTDAPAPSATEIYIPDWVAYVVSVLIFRVTLDLCYIAYVSVAFGDDWVTPLALDVKPDRLLLSYAFLIAVAAMVPVSKSKLSGIYFLAALAFFFIPVTSMIGLNASRNLSTMWWAGAAVFTSVIFSSLRFSVPTWRNGHAAAINLCLAAICFFLFWSIYSGAASQLSLSLSDIYLHRENASALLDVGPLAYLNLWTQKVFTPFLLAIALWNRKWFLAAIFAALHIYYFAVTQHRTHMFVPVLVGLTYLLYAWPYRVAVVYAVMAGLLLAVLSAYLFFDLETAASILIRRAFYVSASVADHWISYFQNHPHVYFSDKLLKDIIQTEYTGQNLPALMSLLVFQNFSFGFNSGMVGAGYAQLGGFGVIMYAAILGLIVRAVDSMNENGLPAFISAAVLFEPLRSAWADSDLFTTLLSHGVAVGVLILLLHGPTRRRQPSAQSKFDK